MSGSSDRPDGNPYRLSDDVIPVRYDLRFEPDLDAGTFHGKAAITLTVKNPTSEIVLNAAELNITDAVIERDAEDPHQGGIELQESLQRCRLQFSVRLQPGTWSLQLSFRGALNDKLRGFYRSRYRDADGEWHVLAATQFEATDARRCFPCWDEPAFKAVFSVTLVIDPSMTAVSNTAVKTERLEDGRKVLTFGETIRMSTYLLAFVVGHLESTEPAMVGRTPLRVWSVPGKRHLAAYGQEIAVFSLRFFEEYYGIPYPGDKLDLLAIPDFASGAMENLGAITFRETALLVDPASATHAELERIADVVAHENAHMWFGDLVTMSWWNGLWLNEAFATFMEMLAVDAWKPEWDRWTTFGVSRAAAMNVDGLYSTRAIEYPVQAPKDADAMFDVLTYEKGASVLRMLEQYLGPDVFRDGVRRYLRSYAYGNADTGDLWAALGGAANQPVPELMDGWIFKPGYPLVTASLQARALVLEQRRFTYLHRPPAGSRFDGSQRWHIPVHIRIATRKGSETRQVLLTKHKQRVELPKGVTSLVLNERGHGFYRVRYTGALLKRLRDHLFDLAPIERFNLLSDTWAVALAGSIPLTDYLDLTGEFRSERDKNVWVIMLESFQTLNRILDPSDRSLLESFVRDRVRPAFDALGWSPTPHETELVKQLRSDLLRALGTLGNDQSVQQRAGELYAAPASIDPSLLPAIIAVLAYTGDTDRYEEFVRRFKTAGTPQEERRFLYALAAFRSPDLIKRTLEKSINGEIRTQDGPFLIGASLSSVYGREQAWEFVKSNWETMERLFPKTGLRRMCGGIVGLATRRLERDVRKFFHERKIDFGGKILEQYLEQLHVVVTLRERETESLRRYLRKFPASRAMDRHSRRTKGATV